MTAHTHALRAWQGGPELEKSARLKRGLAQGRPGPGPGCFKLSVNSENDSSGLEGKDTTRKRGEGS